MEIIPALVIAAIVSGVVAWLVALLNRDTSLTVRAQQTEADGQVLRAKIDADYQLALRRVDADVAATMGERAWADYELRRDTYLDLATHVSVLFSGSQVRDRSEFHAIARRVRLIGSDEVVRELNALTAGIIAHSSDSDQHFGMLFNAVRRDIRRIHSLPPEGTDLGPDAFPIET